MLYFMSSFETNSLQQSIQTSDVFLQIRTLDAICREAEEELSLESKSQH